MNRRFFLDNIWLFVLSLFLILAVVISSFLYLDLLIGKEIEARKNFLSNQVQLCGNSILGEVEAFQMESNFITHAVAWDKIIHDSVVSAKDKRYFRKIITQNRFLIDSIFIYNDSLALKIYQNESNYFFYDQYKGRDEVSALLATLDTNKIIYKANKNNTTLAFRADPVNLFDNKFKDFFVGKEAYKFVVSDDDIHNFGFARNVVNSNLFEMYQEDIDDFRKIIHDNLQAELQQELLVENKPVEVISAMYPLNLFNKHYGIVFSIKKANLIAGVYSSFNNILIVSVGVIVLIIIAFTASLLRISQSSRELEDNKSQLTSLVRQQQLLLEHSEDFTYRHNKDFEYNYISENIERVLGFTPEEFSSQKHRIFTESPINAQARKISKEILNGNTQNSNFFVEILDSDGIPRVLEIKEKPYLNDANEVEGVIGIAKDVSDKFRSDEKFRVLFEYSTDPHMLYDDTGIIDCNEATVRILKGKTKEDVVGHLPSKFSPQYQSDQRNSSEKAKEMKNLAIEKGSHRFEWVHIDLEGTVIPIEVTLTPVSLNNKQVILCVWHDLTERKKVEQTLITAKKRAEDLAESKQQFLSSMSHEIRTPLNAVIGYAHILLNDKPREDQKERLKTLEFSANNLLSLVNDVLDLSKIESGKIEFESNTFDLKDRLTGIKETFVFRASEKGLALNCHFDNELPARVIGDPVRLNQAMTNIIGNAIKFTEAGEVNLYVNVLKINEDDKDITIEFKVTDTGIGISKEKQDLIFDSFVQADSKILNTFGGTGLGLAITKRIVELQGGTIEVESEIGEGSTFRFVLDFKVDDSVLAKNSNSNQAKGLSDANILLVEDNMINQKIATQFLYKWGANVEVANNGKEGVEMLEKDDFDIVLMDLNMPVMDGYEATEKIRNHENERISKTIIIALTADAFTEVRDRVLNAGMNDYITKPINPVVFNKILNKHLSDKQVVNE
jgi:PAS domain S-box-containing protein